MLRRKKAPPMPQPDPLCQSCGLKLLGALGTNLDGTPNPDYCAQCFQRGAFTTLCSKSDMIDRGVPVLVAAGMTAEQARKSMHRRLVDARRWQMPV